MKKLSKRILSILLSVTMVISLLTGCGKKTTESNILDITDVESDYEPETIVSESVDINREELVEAISDEIIYSISTEWEDYVGDVETFIYGLMINQLGYKYDVFPACVELLDGLSISGIAYTDYEECFVNEDETVAYFSAGFIPNVGELTIPEEDFNSGLMVENLEYQDDSTKFILKYQSDEFENHCVVYGKYVTYGVNAEGQMFYTEEEYSRGNCNESLGSLYSFDEARYVYDIDVGEYVYISGESLATQMDFDSLAEEIDKILETQDANFVTVDVETVISFAPGAVTNYILSVQEETFLGYNKESLVEAVSSLDPMECYRITSDGLMTIDLEHATEDEVARWLVGSACVISIAVGLVGSVVSIECPVLSGMSSALAGTAIEIFMQVVVSDQVVSDIEWSKVAIAACSGAVSGLLGPYIAATTGGASAFLIDSALDGLIGGVEQTIYAWMDGEGEDIAKTFGYGFALGFGLSAGFKGVSGLVSKVAQKISPTLSDVGEKLFPKLSGKVSEFSKNVRSKVYGLKRAMEPTVFYSEHVADRIMHKKMKQLVNKGDSKLKELSFASIQKKDILDVEGKSISSRELENLFDVANDGEIIGKFEIGEDVINIKKQNGIVGITFDESKYLTVELSDGIRNNGAPSKKVKHKFREKNFRDAAEKMQKIWVKNPESIPNAIVVGLKEKGLSIEDALPNDIVKIVRKAENGLVMHENIDMKTITLVPRELHDTSIGGISHMGGFGLAGYVKNHMGKEFFDRFVSAAATGTVIAQ